MFSGKESNRTLDAFDMEYLSEDGARYDPETMNRVAFADDQASYMGYLSEDGARDDPKTMKRVAYADDRASLTDLSRSWSIRMFLGGEEDRGGDDDGRGWLRKWLVRPAGCLTLVLITALLVTFAMSATKSQPTSTTVTLSSPSPETPNYQSSNTTLIPPAPWNIKTACSTANILLEQGRQECEESCLPGTCCYTQSNHNCQTNPNCTGYQICANLHNIPNQPILFNSTQVDQACSYKTLSTQGNSKCEQICSPASCCFTSDCDVPSTLNCRTYKSCSTLYDAQQDPGDIHLTNADAEYLVNTTCTKELVSTPDGNATCHDLCKERMCCFVPDSSNCYDEKTQWCDHFAPCQILFHENATTTTEDPSASIQAMVRTTCDVINIQTEEGKRACGELCTAKMCCFSSSTEDNCAENEEMECSDYSACANVVSHTLDISIDEVCSPDNLLLDEGREICKETCFERECCFLDHPFSCYSFEQSWCDEYDVCKDIYNDDQNGNKQVTLPEDSAENEITDTGIAQGSNIPTSAPVGNKKFKNNN